jgi:hypothetical protein
MTYPIRLFRLFALSLCIILSTGCASLINSQASKFADNLGQTMLDSNDPQTVGESMPTFIMLVESMVRGSPEDPSLRAAAAQLNSTYASTFINDEARQKTLANNGFVHAKLAACYYQTLFCDIEKQSFEQVKSIVITEDNLNYGFQLAVSWLGYIQTHSSDWTAISHLPKAKHLFEQILALDEHYQQGMTHLYLGGIATLIPPSLGGQPELGKAHFEKAIALSAGQNLMAKVEYARRYARMMFEQELHHQLLSEVLAAPVEAPGLTLANVLAKQQAKLLLADEADYF